MSAGCRCQNKNKSVLNSALQCLNTLGRMTSQFPWTCYVSEKAR